MKKLIITALCITNIMFSTACGSNNDTVSYDESILETVISEPTENTDKNSYDTLSVSTYITKVDDMYFISDCYHDQVIYNDNLDDSLDNWNVLTNEVHYAHTIAYDGTGILIDDTENNRLLAFQKIDGKYVHTQTLENIGLRPHYVQYDEKNNVFMAWSSITGEMYMIKRGSGKLENGVYPLYIDKILKIDELYGVYVRSFTIMDDGIYFVSGHNNEKIIKTVINEEGSGFEIVSEYEVIPEIAGMVQIIKIEDYYYITVSTDNTENQDYATIIRTDSLEKLATGDYEDIYSQFGISGGTPYYITKIGDTYYMAHHRTAENIVAFHVDNNNIEDVQIIY